MHAECVTLAVAVQVQYTSVLATANRLEHGGTGVVADPVAGEPTAHVAVPCGDAQDESDRQRLADLNAKLAAALARAEEAERQVCDSGFCDCCKCAHFLRSGVAVCQIQAAKAAVPPADVAPTVATSDTVDTAVDDEIAELKRRVAVAEERAEASERARSDVQRQTTSRLAAVQQQLVDERAQFERDRQTLIQQLAALRAKAAGGDPTTTTTTTTANGDAEGEVVQ